MGKKSFLVVALQLLAKIKNYKLKRGPLKFLDPSLQEVM